MKTVKIVRKNNIIYKTAFLTIFIFSFLIASAQSNKTDIRIKAAGDIIFHGPIVSMAKKIKKENPAENSYLYFLKLLPEDALKADISMVNFENPIAYKTGGAPVPFIFNAPLESYEAFEKIGVNLFNLANNHIYDQEVDGLDETIEALSKTGLTGLCDKEMSAIIKTFEINGKKIMLAGITRLLNVSKTLNRLQICHLPQKNMRAKDKEKEFLKTEENFLKKLKEQSKEADVFIAQVHWGTEYIIEPHQMQTEFAQQLAESGVDIILGHHPHFVQGYDIIKSNHEVEKQTLVFYSLGNFFSNQGRKYKYQPNAQHDHNSARTRDGVIIDLVLKNSKCEDNYNIKMALKKEDKDDLTICAKAIPTWMHRGKVNKKFFIGPVLSERAAFEKEFSKEKSIFLRSAERTNELFKQPVSAK
ncbi:MAG: CapA family protein [Spirochaetia bacterium]|nr:CapA family protein [Spirochaetia bacterium]